MDSKEQVTLFEKARKRAVAKKQVYYHFVIFLIGSVFLIVLNTVFNVGEQYGEWFKYAVAIWLFVWIFHFVNVFITHRFFGKEWVQNETAKLMAKHDVKVKELEKKLLKKGVLTSNSPIPSSPYSPKNSIEKKQRTSPPPPPHSKKHITLIAAIGKNGELGKDNELIWHLPNDLKRFKKVTAGHDVIMGRKTFESLGKPLPQRTNIVVTRNTGFHADGCLIAHSLEEALKLSTDQNPYILGGAQIYAQAIKMADVLDLTLVNASLDADAHFPKIDNTIWKETSRENFSADDKHQYNYSFVRMERRN
ncbi:dihydrofolate reductase [Flavobacteriaceae bacterium F08102]|nr:dihydrofolate reductase [Flavobacteriaceae bacterium F08102]